MRVFFPALFALAGAANICDDDATPERPVVVVGAGFSGLSTARALAAFGCPVVVYEARDRLGGRAHSWPQDGTLLAGVDLGPHWIEGNSPLRNPVKRLVLEFGLNFTSVSTRAHLNLDKLDLPVYEGAPRLNDLAIFGPAFARFSEAELLTAVAEYLLRLEQMKTVSLELQARGLERC